MVDVRKKLNRAPIKEAVIDFRTYFSEEKSRSDFERVHEKLRREYPKVEDIHHDQIEFNLSQKKPELQSFSHTFRGIRCTSEDGRFVVQIRDNGLTISRLAPYNTWEELESEARRAWSIYQSALEPDTITRIAVRYINRILLRFHDEKIDLDDYFLFGIKAPKEIPQTILSSLCQLKLVEDSGAVANVNLTTQKVEEQILPVIFDIDVFRGGRYALDKDEPWTVLLSLRDLKNRIFFSSITQRTLELLD